MKRGFWTIAIFVIFVAGMGLAAAPVQPGTAARQEGGGWSGPVNLSYSETQSANPALAVDPAGGVHVVWSEETEDGRSFISYAGLKDGNWSEANEIAGSPYTETADYPTLAADANGYLHLAWRGDGTLYYSRAYALQAGQAQGWSAPAALEYVQEDIGRPHLQVDAAGGLHLVYPILLGSESGIFYMKSSNGGQSWSDPQTIYKNRRSDRTVDMPRLAIADDGKLHVAWVEADYPESFPPIGIRYSRSSDGGLTWKETTNLVDGPYSYPAVITRGAQEVHVVYSGTAEDRYKFHRWSTDGGLTWENVYRNTEVGGYQGLPALVLDSDNNLHWLTTASVFRIKNDSVYQTIWDNNWKPGEVVLRGDPVDQNASDIAAEIGLGDELHMVVQYPIHSDTQPGGWQYEIKYMYKELDSPHTAGQALVTPTAVVPTPTQAHQPPTDNKIQPTLAAVHTQPAEVNFNQPGTVIAGALAGLALTVVILLSQRRKNF